MDIELRVEREEDYQETENLTREAFYNCYCEGCCEHYLLHILRDCPSFVRDLDIVAIKDGRIVGNIVYVKGYIYADSGHKYEVLTLGPISVLPEYQNHGIASQMISYTKKKAKDMGFGAIVLCGDPEFYKRQGFVLAETLKIRTIDSMYMDALQVCELFEGALKDAKGYYQEDPIYEVNQESVDIFDQQFPYKEKVKGTPSQKRFEKVCQMIKYAPH